MTDIGKVKIKNLGQMTMKIQVARRLKFRIWLSLLLVRFGVWILGAETEIERTA